MRITFLAADLSGGNMMRPYLLALALKGRHEVRVVGPILGKESGRPWPARTRSR